MALFVLNCHDKPNALDLRMATREAHLAYVRPQLDILKLGGPLLDDQGDMAGSLMILDVADRAAAPGAPKAPAKKASIDRAAAFARMDTNHDGVLTLEEYVAGLNGAANLEQRFKNFDKNGDGKLSREEFVAPSAK